MTFEPDALSDDDVRRLAREMAGPPRAVERDQTRLVGGGDFIFDEPDHIPALWGSGDRVLWAEGEGVMIAGGQGLGKTTITQQLVLSRAGVHQPHLFGLPVAPSGGRALYLAMDRPRQAARSMRRMVPETHRDYVTDRVLVWRGPVPVDVTADRDAFADWVQSLDSTIDLVVVDSVKDLVPGLVKDDVAAAVNIAWQEVIARGVQLVLLHHERKSDGSGRAASLDHVYGSTWLTSGLGSVLQLSGTPGDPEVTLHHLKQPAEEVGPLTLMHDHANGRTALIVQVTVEDALRMASAPVTIADLAEQAGVDPRTAARRVKALVGQRRALQVSGATQTSSGRLAATYVWHSGLQEPIDTPE